MDMAKARDAHARELAAMEAQVSSARGEQSAQ